MLSLHVGGTFKYINFNEYKMFIRLSLPPAPRVDEK